MLLAKKVVQATALETEELFKNKVKFLLNESGKPEEVMFFNDSGHAAIKVALNGYEMKVDHIAFVTSQLSEGTEETLS